MNVPTVYPAVKVKMALKFTRNSMQGILRGQQAMELKTMNGLQQLQNIGYEADLLST